jgi:hypothetical protein
MGITVATADPRGLLEAIKLSIKEGHIETWQYKDGYFTHTPEQWRYKAFLKPTIGAQALTLNIVRPKDGNVSSEAYAIYHGRFIEMLLAHFDGIFVSTTASAMVMSGDLV